MKRITTFLLALAMCCSGAAAALAVDVKVSGVWDFAGGWEQTGFKDVTGKENDNISARERLRTQINFVASEQLQGVVAFEIGTLNWGSSDSSQFYGGAPGGALDSDGINVETRRAYLDWTVPRTDVTVRMGIQNMVAPFAAGMGNPVISDDVAGIVVSSPINDMLGVTAFWLRPYDANFDDGDEHYADETDLFGLVLPITGNGWSLTPWGMAGSVGGGSGYYQMAYPDSHLADIADQTSSDQAFAWWAGGALKIDLFDPLTFGMDAVYGRVNRTELTFDNVNTTLPDDTYTAEVGTKGWFVDAALNYKLDWATPGLFGWWGSGDKADALDDGNLGRLPSLTTWDGDGFYPTSFGFSGGAGPTEDGQVALTGAGTWGVGAQIADISFIDNLSHTLRVAYYQGTNNTENAREHGDALNYDGEMYLTTGDHVWEVDFNHKYQMYENLTAYLELGYLHLSMDKDAWGDNIYDSSDDAWKAQVLFKYSF